MLEVASGDGDLLTSGNVTTGDGTGIAYRYGGTGPPLVLVQGTAADHSRWRPVLPFRVAHRTSRSRARLCFERRPRRFSTTPTVRKGAPMANGNGRLGGIGLGGILVILGIILAIVWSVWIGIIIALVGLVAFGGFAKGRWY